MVSGFSNISNNLNTYQPHLTNYTNDGGINILIVDLLKNKYLKINRIITLGYILKRHQL